MKKSTLQKSGLPGGILAVAFILLLTTRSADASPPWWEGNAEDLPAAASQTGKPVVLYFHSPSAAECIRMEEETWQPMNPIWADLQFLWMKLEPKKDAEFFKYWQINQVPQVVVLDSDMRDQLRLRGFMELDQVKESLQRIQRNVPKIYTTFNGGTVSANNPVLDTRALEDDPNRGHAYFESFDSYRLLGSISNPPFSPIVQAASKIDLKQGIDGSPCLVVDSGTNTSSLFQIDVSRDFAQVDQVLGRLRLTVDLKSTSAMGRLPVDVVALYVVRTDDVEDPAAQEQNYYIALSDSDRDRWKTREIISGPINLRQNRAFVMMSTQTPNTSFLIDNITVDILPVDDLIPFVDTESNVATIASLKGDSSSKVAATGSADTFYENLSNRAKIRESSSVSNNVSSSPDAKANANRVGAAPDEVIWGEDQIEATAIELLEYSARERSKYMFDRGISGRTRTLVIMKITELEQAKR